MEDKTPVVEEIAADIFMGNFTKKYLEAAKRAQRLLDGSLYATYYDIQKGSLYGHQIKLTPSGRPGFSVNENIQPVNLGEICKKRTGVKVERWNTKHNKMILEQEQILTTHNLATLFETLDLKEAMQERFLDLAKDCFAYSAQTLQTWKPDWHSQMLQVKNSAYSWRQMIFYLSFVSDLEFQSFLEFTSKFLQKSSPQLEARLHPIVRGLLLASQGISPFSAEARQQGAKAFLGWSEEKHWLFSLPANE